MKTIALTAAMLVCTATAAHADPSFVPVRFQGPWATTARACHNSSHGMEMGRGQILVDEGGYTGSTDQGNAAIRRVISTVRGRVTYDVIFSAVADRQWPGRMSMRRVGARLGVTKGRNAERLYVSCPN